MNTPAQLVERFLAEMRGWEEHMHRIPHILETRQSSDGHEVTVKLNDAFGSLVKISVCPDENGLLKLRNIQLNEGGKWKAHSF